MKIAVIGSGNVGSILGTRWANDGRDVIFGVRDPNSLKVKSLLKMTNNKASATTIGEAAAASDIVVLATPWSATRQAIEAAGNLRGKIVVDCTNPIAEGGKDLSVGHSTSAGEKVAEWATGARVVKAFNTTGANNMANPRFAGDRAVMFICGDNKTARNTVADLAESLGFEVCDAGVLFAARFLEPIAMLWIHLAYTQGMGREFAFKIVKR